MRQIERSDIAGARIVAVHEIYELVDQWLDSTQTFFTTDRGVSFTLPNPGFPWHTTDVPANAELLPNEVVSPSFEIKQGWFFRKIVPGPTRIIDVVKRMKQQTIAGVYFRREEGIIADGALMVFKDGSQASSMLMAPNGTGATGLTYRSNPPNGIDFSELVDYFDVPLKESGLVT